MGLTGVPSTDTAAGVVVDLSRTIRLPFCRNSGQDRIHPVGDSADTLVDLRREGVD